MSKGNNAPGLSKLAGVLKGMAQDQIPTDLKLDFGVIQKDKSLLTNTFGVAIPKTDYLVCQHLKSRSASTSTVDGHHHSVDTQRKLAVGDRVLVAWVQDDAVVIDVILEADSVL